MNISTLVSVRLGVIWLSAFVFQLVSALDCDVRAGGKCFRIFNDELLTWKAGEEHCREWGGHLAVIETKEENQLVRSLAYDTTWIGLSRTSHQAQWTWTDGSAFFGSSDTSWRAGLLAASNCLALSKTPNFEWTRMPCGMKGAVLCSKQKCETNCFDILSTSHQGEPAANDFMQRRDGQPVTPSDLFADLVGVGRDQVGSWEIRIALDTDQACQPEGELLNDLTPTINDAVEQATTSRAAVQVSQLVVDLGSGSCPRSPGTDAVAVVTTIVAFTQEGSSGLDLEKLESNPAIKSAAPIDVPSKLEAKEESGSSKLNIPLVAAAAAIGAAIILTMALIMILERRSPTKLRRQSGGLHLGSSRNIGVGTPKYDAAEINKGVSLKDYLMESDSERGSIGGGVKGNTYAPVGTLPDLEEAADASPMFQKPPQVLGSESPVMPVTGYLRSESPVAHHEISNEPPMTVSDLGYEGQRQVGSRAAHPNDTPSVESIPPKVKREVMWNLNGYNDPDLFRRPGQLPPPNSAVYPGLNDSSGPLPSGWDDPDLVRPDNHVGSLFAPFLNLVGIETPRVGEAVNKAKPGKNNTVPEQHPAAQRPPLPQPSPAVPGQMASPRTAPVVFGPITARPPEMSQPRRQDSGKSSRTAGRERGSRSPRRNRGHSKDRTREQRHDEDPGSFLAREAEERRRRFQSTAAGPGGTGTFLVKGKQHWRM